MNKTMSFAGGGAILLAAAALLQPGSLLASPNSSGSARAGVPARVAAAGSSTAAKRPHPAPGKPDECTRDADCGPGFGCFHGGRCLCKPGRRLCKTTCADLQHDAQNCGDCGHACPAGDACIQGGCRPPESVSSLAITPEITARSRSGARTARRLSLRWTSTATRRQTLTMSAARKTT